MLPSATVAPKIPHLRRLHIAHQPRIINRLDGMKLGHDCPFPLAAHDYTLLGAPHLRAARTRVCRLLFLGRLESLLGKNLRATPALYLLECVLHEAVFQRVVTQHHPPSPGANVAGTRYRNCPSASNSRFTAIRSARNVFVAGCSFCLPLEVTGPCHNRCQVCGVADRPRTNNGPGDSSGIPLFA